MDRDRFPLSPLRPAFLCYRDAAGREHTLGLSWVGIVGASPALVLAGLCRPQAQLNLLPTEFAVSLPGEAVAALALPMESIDPGTATSLVLACRRGTVLREGGATQVRGELRTLQWERTGDETGLERALRRLGKAGRSRLDIPPDGRENERGTE